jgi:hypothetical protein
MQKWITKISRPYSSTLIASLLFSLATIIESYWRQIELYEQSKEQLHAAEDELANMKEYLNEVLKEVSNMRKQQIQ